MALTVAVVNYGMGNIHSIYRKLSGLDVRPMVASTSEEILSADKIVLPGVGHFARAMMNIRKQGLYDALNEAVLVRKVPILGICLGMQLMAAGSEEGEAPGFGWVNAKVVRFTIDDKIKYKVPQTGWNSIKFCKESRLLENIEDNAEFYFLHSYHFAETSPDEQLAVTHFSYEYVSAVEKENIFGTQFHPEKSHNQGIQLLKNFIQL